MVDTVDTVVMETERLCNSFGSRPNGFAFALGVGTWHKTLQQTYMRDFIIPIIRELSKAYPDGRNEATVNLCKQLIDICDKEDNGLPFI